jgi:UDP-GlcNAc:undecaprenyl-phosphate GlcNAc-1-phosphate transferase
LVDDIKPLPRSVRLAAQLGAAVAAWELGFQVNATTVEPLNLALTVVWIVGITNAFNLLDNMDGLSAGLAGVGAISFGVMGVLGGQPVVAIAMLSLAGASLGFLAHNKHPAKVFMGDAGSLFIGFLLALMGIRLQFENLIEVTFLVPVVVLGLPIFDTTLVVLSRVRHGRPVFLGGRDHVSHRLVRGGLPVKYAVGLLYWTGLCLGWLGLVISRSNVQVAYMLLGFAIAMALFLGALLWQVPVYDEEEGAVESDEEAIAQEGVAYLSAVDNTSDRIAGS